LVHFSDHARKIAQNGFIYGSDDMSKLGLTTYYTKDSKSHGGYNFAFEAQSRDASNAASQGSYGRHAVMFQNSGARAWHMSDEEHQVIFWGQDVDPRSIIELRNDHGDWVVTNGTRDFYSGDFDQVVKWVIANHSQYRRALRR
jgi:hypothetical protein